MYSRPRDLGGLRIDSLHYQPPGLDKALPGPAIPFSGLSTGTLTGSRRRGKVERLREFLLLGAPMTRSHALIWALTLMKLCVDLVIAPARQIGSSDASMMVQFTG